MSAFLKKICIASFTLALLDASAQTYGYSNQFDIDQLRLQQMQIELHTLQLQAETTRLQKEATESENIIEELANRAAEEQAATEKAEELARLQSQIQRANVRSANNMYALFFVGSLFIIGFHLRKKKTMNTTLNFNQKFGMLVMIFAAITFIFLLVLSDNWAPDFDFVQNLLIMRIRFWESHQWESPYLIDFPTKYALMLVTVGFAYGLTTYLGITPAWERAKSFIAHERNNS